MQNFRQIVAVAAIAGLGAGLLTALAHYYTTLPLIAEAELFWHSLTSQQIVVGAGAVDLIRQQAEWQPVGMFERFARTAFKDLGQGLGFAFVLTAVFMALNQAQTWRTGAYWGLAGFAALGLAPAVVLAPELPGMVFADPLARQIWFAVTAMFTAGGIAILVFRRRNIWMGLLAVAMIIAPHAYGAPPWPNYALSKDLVWSYIASDVGTALLFWVILGASTAILYQRRIRTENV
jgi:cobalt transporter subunit CbtA